MTNFKEREWSVFPGIVFIWKINMCPTEADDNSADDEMLPRDRWCRREDPECAGAYSENLRDCYRNCYRRRAPGTRV
jgi:hypothetical protein